MKPGRPKRRSFCRVFKNAPITGYESPDVARRSKEFDPFQIRRVSSIGKLLYISNMYCNMTEMADEAMKR
jgi:hypothetical protein